MTVFIPRLFSSFDRGFGCRVHDRHPIFFGVFCLSANVREIRTGA